MSALYEFDPEDVRRFAREQGAKAYTSGEQFHFVLCPYCKGGKDHGDRGTFAISLKNGTFNCKRASCGAKGNMLTLARDFNFELSDDVSRYYRTHDYRGGRFRSFGRTEKIVPKDKAVEYMASRGISKEVCERYEITTKKDNDSIIVFPFRDGEGKLTFIKYRNINPERKGNKEWTESNCMPILYGMYQCEPDNHTLVLTEGQIDSLSVTECGIKNAVSVPTGAKGFTWIPHCWDWLQNFDTIVVFGDHEHGSITLLETMRQRFGRQKTIKHVREEDYKDCKDANDILRKYGKEQVTACVNNAVPVPVECLIDMADVKELDPDKVMHIPTGIYPLDRLLDGGLPAGMVTCLNGKTGEGKSTFSNMTICSAIADGHKVMVYSGEMAKEQLKYQLMLQLAGPDFVESYKTQKGKIRTRVKSDFVGKINDWLRGKVYMYDCSIIREGDEYGELTAVIEKAIQQYGVDYVIIDNLMTAIDLTHSNSNAKYDRQGDFTATLARLAIEYSMAVLLIAHRRKTTGYIANENDEVLGSSQVTNLIGVNIFYGKEPDNKKQEHRKTDKNGRIIKVTKNRITGDCNYDGIEVRFDSECMRIYHEGKHDNHNTSFGWNNSEQADQEEMFEAHTDIEDWEIPF